MFPKVHTHTKNCVTTELSAERALSAFVTGTRVFSAITEFTMNITLFVFVTKGVYEAVPLFVYP